MRGGGSQLFFWESEGLKVLKLIFKSNINYMKYLALLVLFFLYPKLNAQPNTEIFLVDISKANGKISLSNLRNISNNEGYDNQPSFYDDNSILFSSTRNGQTDIAKYDITSGEISWLTDTPVGSEYSPLRIPESDDVSAIRLDTNGLQRLYQYDISTGKPKELLRDLKVGYHVWTDKENLVSSVLVENEGMNLMVSNLKDGSNRTIRKSVGRSLHKIPNSDLVSFIKFENDPFRIESLNPVTGETKKITSAMASISDICWLPDGTILVGDGNGISKFDTKTDEKWEMIWRFKEKEITKISRMAVSPDGKHLAIVSEESPAKIVQKQVDSFNAGDLEAFVNCYSKDVVVRNFPDGVRYIGHENMRQTYSSLSPDNKVYDVVVTNRIVIGNQVIDEEKVSQNGKFQQMQVALYEVNNGKISSMTFIFDDDEAPNPETIVQKQLDAYNARDIEGFLETYTEDVQLYNFPAEKTSEGQTEMREGYSGFFENTPDLNCEIKNRIVIANKVIDEEYITANGNNFSAVAIYEVENGKIAKVTFLR